MGPEAQDSDGMGWRAQVMPVLWSQRNARMRAWSPVGAGGLGAIPGCQLGLAVLGSHTVMGGSGPCQDQGHPGPWA